MRLDYIPFLRTALLSPLLKDGKDGVSQVVDLLDQYGLSKDDFTESLREMQFKVENDKTLIDQYELLDTQTKTALTKYYNKYRLPNFIILFSKPFQSFI
jgi:replication factor C subunit 1